LTTRFKPEQIARFGNIHIIYPSLSKGSYQEIIRRKLREAADAVRELHGIEVAAEKSFDEMIYGNGVFPLQGTRPVFTTLAATIGLSFPRAVLLALESGADTVSISYSQEKKAFICSAGDAEIEVPYAGDLDALREKCRHDTHRRREVAVHEAGHAVVHAVLNGIAPLQTNALTIDGNGFTHCHDMGRSPQGVMRGIAVGIAGTMAEEMVFGIRNAGRGNRNDIDETTSRISELIRRSGVVEGFPAMVMSNDRYQVYDADVDRTNERIRELIGKARDFVGDLLKDHSVVLTDVAEALFQKGELSAEKFVEVCNGRIPVKVLEEEDLLTAPYDDLFAESVKNMKDLSRGDHDYCEELYNIFCEDKND